jgi:3D-(3,5/4)-trihydroxycyclohexane-1,2-dione acylhydrolase (decyclizing)
MGNTELVTAVQEGLKIVVVIIENGGYQSIRGLQVGKTGTEFGTELRRRDRREDRLSGALLEIDYVANARSMGCCARRANSLEELVDAIAQARAQDGPSVIVVPVEPHRLMSGTECFWDVGIAQHSSRDDVRALAGEHLAGQRAQRYFAPSRAETT